MREPAEVSGHVLLSIGALEQHPAPKFLIKLSTAALKFDILYANEALRTCELRDVIMGQNKEALLFRSWAQSFGGNDRSRHGFAGWTWSAEVAKDGGALKMISGERTSDENPAVETRERPSARLATDRSPIPVRSREESMRGLNLDRKVLSHPVPRTHLSAHWEGLHTMMDMSDVGVFEYNLEGKLIHANEAWYKMR
jgi:hypothetical protein